MLSAPRIEEKVGLYRFIWDEEKITVSVSNVRNGDDSPTAELVIRSNSEMASSHLHQTRLNLLATPTKVKLAEVLGKKYKALELPWDDIIETVAVLTLRKIRQGIPAKRIIGGMPVPEQQHLLYPFLPKNQPTIIYGFGGVGKSYLAQYMCLCVKNAWTDNPCEFMPGDKPINVGYLDWETEEEPFHERINKVLAGSRQASFEIDYLKMYGPIAGDIERVQNFLLDNDIGFIVIDSAAGATGGDLNAAEPTIRMFNALRQFNVTSLILAHTAKGGNGKDTSVYGSVFFFNYARSVLEQKKAEVEIQGGMNIELHHRKSNDTELFEKVPFKIAFTKDTVTIEKGEDGPFAKQKKQRQEDKVFYALRDNGKMTDERIAELLKISIGSVRVATHRLKAEGKAQKFDGEWGLLARIEEESLF